MKKLLLVLLLIPMISAAQTAWSTNYVQRFDYINGDWLTAPDWDDRMPYRCKWYPDGMTLLLTREGEKNLIVTFSDELKHTTVGGGRKARASNGFFGDSPVYIVLVPESEDFGKQILIIDRGSGSMTTYSEYRTN